MSDDTLPALPLPAAAATTAATVVATAADTTALEDLTEMLRIRRRFITVNLRHGSGADVDSGMCDIIHASNIGGRTPAAATGMEMHEAKQSDEIPDGRTPVAESVVVAVTR